MIRPVSTKHHFTHLSHIWLPSKERVVGTEHLMHYTLHSLLATTRKTGWKDNKKRDG